MKGFAITLDAIVAISFFLFAVIVIGTQSYRPIATGDIYLKELTLDTLSVLEKSGRINQALDGNISGMQTLIEATPNLACMDVSVLDAKGDVVLSVVKSGCTEVTDLDIQTTARPVIYLGSTYIIRSVSWLRKEGG